jgi:hypothetical protein
LSTGEDIPKGQSLRARVFIVEMNSSDVNWDLVSQCQRDAAEGLYAQAVAGFLQWIAKDYEGFVKKFRAAVIVRRQGIVHGPTGHKRMPEILANLATALSYWFEFCVEIGALSAVEFEQRWRACHGALEAVAAAQGEHQLGSDPVYRFVELLSTAIASGRAHLAGEHGGEPEHPESWGWRLVMVGAGDYERPEWRPQGSRVGWIVDHEVFLDPDASYAAAQVVGRDVGESIPVMAKTLHKRLDERGVLVSTDRGRHTLTVRHVIEGRRREVLHVRRDLLGDIAAASGEALRNREPL